MHREELATLLGRELPGRVPDLAAAYLFGSFARGQQHPKSDVDIGLLYSAPPASTLDAQPFVLAGDLATLLERNVDVVVLNSAPVDLIHRVLRDGILLVDANPSARIAFEVRSRNEYFDLLPFLRRYRKQPEAP
jgi:predicted nucleotidyltransferase